jgi:hypothetical protein
MRRRPSKIFIDSVFKNPDHKSNENKETKTRHPEIPCQRPQENPCIFAVVVHNRDDHGDTTFSVRQSKINILGSVENNSCISNYSIKILLIASKESKISIKIRFACINVSQILFQILN